MQTCRPHTGSLRCRRASWDEALRSTNSTCPDGEDKRMLKSTHFLAAFASTSIFPITVSESRDNLEVGIVAYSEQSDCSTSKGFPAIYTLVPVHGEMMELTFVIGRKPLRDHSVTVLLPTRTMLVSCGRYSQTDTCWMVQCTCEPPIAGLHTTEGNTCCPLTKAPTW